MSNDDTAYRALAALVTDVLLGELAHRDMAIEDVPPHPGIAAMAGHIDSGDMTQTKARELVRAWLDGEAGLGELLAETEWRTDTDIRGTVETVADEHPQAVNDAAWDYLVGRVMAATDGRADPETAKALVREVAGDE